MKKSKDQEAVNEEKAQLVEEQQENNEEKPTESSEDSNDDAVSEWKDKHLRLYSEFENFRRRMAKEKLELTATAGRDLMESLLPILDDFHRAQLSAGEDQADLASVREGIQLVHQKLVNTLTTKGLKKMETKKGDEFDDEYHEAVTQIPAEEELAGKIVDVIEPGYF